MGFYLWAIFVVFFNSRISAQGNFLQICISWTGIRIRIRTKKQLDLDPNPHWKKQLDPDPQKWMRIHNQGLSKIPSLESKARIFIY